MKAKPTIVPEAEGSGFSVKDMNSKDFEAWRKEFSDYLKHQKKIKPEYEAPTPALPNTTGP
jgi:hypothetical protein